MPIILKSENIFNWVIYCYTKQVITSDLILKFLLLLYTDRNVFMSTNISLSFLIITGAFLSAQATTAQSPSPIDQDFVVNNTLKSQVSVVKDLTNIDLVTTPVVQTVATTQTSPRNQTDVFLSDVAKTPRKVQQISAIPPEAQSEASVEIPVPRPLTQTIKGQSVTPIAQIIRSNTVSPPVTIPVAIPGNSNPVPTANTSVPIDSNNLSRSHPALLYPLTTPAPITSRFGWRTHPLTGSRRFHSGLDIGAPSGAPAVATGAGTVISAGWNGGYGKAVIIQHSDTQQTLYGHLSEISVQAGQTVTQGTVIGLVGSTGNSTGPHLHFESRMPVDGVWTAVDPSQEIQYAVDTLRRSMPYARKELPPGI
jgi:murein DD-endopeptidase MepM/ murein hydrolase activator NlpD